MAKKEQSHLEIPNYEAILSIEAVDEEIEKHKQNLVGKDRVEYRMKEDKKAYTSAINEQLKELKEEREHEINVIGALEQRRQLLANGGTSVAMPSPPAGLRAI